MRQIVTGLWLIVAGMAFVPTVASATAIMVSPLDEPVEIATSPTITIKAHGPQSPVSYRMTLEIENTFTTCPLIMEVPKGALTVFIDEDTQRRVVNRDPDDSGNIWLQFDDRETRHPLRRMKVAYFARSGEEIEYIIKPTFIARLNIPPGGTAGVDLDFNLPIDRIPETFTLYINEQDVGCGVFLTVKEEEPLQGQLGLRLLRRQR